MKLNSIYIDYYSPKQLVKGVESAFKTIKKNNKSINNQVKNVLLQRRAALQIKALSINKILKHKKNNKAYDMLLNQQNFLFSEIKTINKYDLKNIKQYDYSEKDLKLLKDLLQVDLQEGKKGYLVYTDYQIFKNELLMEIEEEEGINKFDIEAVRDILGNHSIKEIYKKYNEQKNKIKGNDSKYRIINLVGGLENFIKLLFSNKKNALSRAIKKIKKEDAKVEDILSKYGI